MPKFKDKKGREWMVDISVGMVKKLRKEISIDIADPSGEVLNRLADDPVLLADVLWLICETQAKEQEISDEEFGRALVGDPIDDASAAMSEAIADFFPARRNALLRKAARKIETVRAKAESLVMERLDDPEMEAKLEAAIAERVEKEMQAALTTLSGHSSLPDSSAE